jgi:ATP-dependent DNA helicase RecQ
MPAYIVFGDATLRGIALTQPTTLAALGTISGVGEKKLESYGAGVLAVVNGGDPAEAAATSVMDAAAASSTRQVRRAVPASTVGFVDGGPPPFDDEPPPDDDYPLYE